MSTNARTSTMNMNGGSSGAGQGQQVEKTYFESQREMLVLEIAQVCHLSIYFPLSSMARSSCPPAGGVFLLYALPPIASLLPSAIQAPS